MSPVLGTGVQVGAQVEDWERRVQRCPTPPSEYLLSSKSENIFLSSASYPSKLKTTEPKDEGQTNLIISHSIASHRSVTGI